MAVDRLEVTAFSRRGPAPGRLPELRWSVRDEPFSDGLFHLLQAAAWEDGAGSWDVPVEAGRGVTTPRLVGWRGRWDRRRGLWLQRWTLQAGSPDQTHEGGLAGEPNASGEIDRSGGAGARGASLVGGRTPVVDTEVDRVHCHGEVLPHRVLVEAVMEGGLYVLGGATPAGMTGDSEPLLHRAYRIEGTTLLDLPEARGEGEEWVASASVQGVWVRPAMAATSAGRGPEEFEITALVHLQWRLLREEMVELPLPSPEDGVVGGKFLSRRVLAEGTNHVPVRGVVSVDRLRADPQPNGAGRFPGAGSFPGAPTLRADLSKSTVCPQVVRVSLPPVALRSMDGLRGLQVFLDPDGRNAPRWAVLERGGFWRRSGPTAPAGIPGRPVALIAAEWHMIHGAPTSLTHGPHTSVIQGAPAIIACAVTVAVQPEAGNSSALGREQPDSHRPARLRHQGGDGLGQRLT